MGVVRTCGVSILCPTGPCVLEFSGVFFGLVDEFFHFSRFVYAVDPFGDCRWVSVSPMNWYTLGGSVDKM